MFIMLLFGITEVTEIPTYVAAIIVAIPVLVLGASAKFGNQNIQTWVVLISSGVYSIVFMVTFLYDLITGFIDGCFISPIVVTYSLVFGCYLVMTILHPRQIPDFFYGLTYPLTLPFMLMVLPLYCLFNMDDISWGTREQKNPAKSFKKQNGEGMEIEEKDKQWTFDIFTQPVEKASESAEVFWKSTIEQFLKPMKLTGAEEDVIKKDLRMMKMVTMGVLFLSYLAYSLLMILKKEFPLPRRLPVNLSICGAEEPMDFIEVTLFLFMSAVLGFLLVGTVLHRAETLGHIIRTTRVRKVRGGADNSGATLDVTHVQGDVFA